MALMDVLVGSMVLVMGSVAFFSLIPTVRRAETLAGQQTVAVQIANRMIEHLQLLTPTNLNATTLTQLNLIDTGQTEEPYTFTHLPMDEGSDYSPATNLPNATGTLTITDLDAGAKMVQVTITWENDMGAARSFSTGTVVGGYR